MIRAFALCGGYLELPYESMIRDAPPSRWTVPIECFLVEHPRGEPRSEEHTSELQSR